MTSPGAVSHASSRFRLTLPTGGALDADIWERRHRGIVLLLAAHALGIFVYALGRGQSLEHALLDGGIVALLAVLALTARAGRAMRAALATTGLFASSALIVHLSHGVIEMHFHFFFVVALLSIYQEWLPFGLGLVYFVLHHGILGVAVPEAVFNHQGAYERPWLWAGIHTAFFVGASVASLLAWRQNETAHAKADAAARRLYSEQLRHKQALEINDNVVQGLAVTKYALDAGDHEFASQALQGTLGSARQIVTELLDGQDGDPSLGPGDLIRLDPAVVTPPPE